MNASTIDSICGISFMFVAEKAQALCVSGLLLL